jgi:hypothetical protein
MYLQVQPAGASTAEMVVMAVVILAVLGAGWVFYQKFSGRTKSDVSGLHFRQRK